MTYYFLVLAIIFFMANMVNMIKAQDVGDRRDLACITSLRLPQYPPLAQAARRSGTVRVIRLAADSEPASAKVESPWPELTNAVRDALAASTFVPQCPLTIEYVFVVEGPPSATRRVKIDCEPPMRFRISINPQVLNVDN